MRQAILEFLINYTEKIGGPDLIVQIDETLIFHKNTELKESHDKSG